MKIQTYRNSHLHISLPLNKAIHNKRLMSEHTLVFTISTANVLDITIGDYLTYKGEVMTVNQEPQYAQSGSNVFEYVVTFQGARHTLERFRLKDEGAFVFDYFGDLNDYMFMFLECLNSVDSGWTVGELEHVEPFALEFNKVDCLSALNDIAEASKCEWQIIGKEITIKKTVGTARALTLQYGKDNGLYSLSRQTLVNSSIITRAYAVGGTQNLPEGYSKKQLTLDGYLDDPVSVDLYGVREGIFEDQEIYPKRTGSVTGIEQINDRTFSISDNSLDFDLNGQRIEGTEAKIVFKSGGLNGQEFAILSYSPTTKTIRYKANEDSSGNVSPFGAMVAEVGDLYTLIGIRMPESYVTSALSELEAKRLEYLNSNKVPRVVYELDTDILWLKRQNTELYEGDIVHVVDEKIGLNDNIRVTAVSYPALFPVLEQGMKFTAEIGNEVTYTRIQKVEKDIKETKEVVTQVSKTSIENDRRNIQALNEFKGLVFDPDGNLENALIQAIAGLFGTDSMYYDLDGISLTVNAGNNANSINLTAGELIHKRYKIDGLGYIWDLPVFNADGLIPTKPYYLAAKCSQTALTGEWVLTTDQQDVDSENGYWFFNLGILSSVIEGKRSFRPTKMFTMISGGDIETDTITAYFINVVRLFAQLISVGSDGYSNAGISGLADAGNSSVRFWAGATAENRNTAPYKVLNDGSMSATKGKIGGFEIDSTTLRSSNIDDGGSNPTNPSSGIILSDWGVLSRNAGMSFLPSSTGLDFSGSLVGEASVERPLERPIFTADVRAGLIGVRRQDLAAQALQLLSGAWGRYGAMLSSVKLLGAIYEPVRIDNDNADTYITEFDYYVAKGGSNSNVYLPSVGVEIGRSILIKNATGGNITIYGNGIDIYKMDNTASGNSSLVRGGTYKYRYSGNQWLEGYG